MQADNQSWKVAMFQSLEEEVRKKIGKEFAVGPASIKELVIQELTGEE